jgi:hypothetical protein
MENNSRNDPLFSIFHFPLTLPLFMSQPFYLSTFFDSLSAITNSYLDRYVTICMFKTLIQAVLQIFPLEFTP